METKIKNKFKVGDKVYVTLDGSLDGLLYETKLCTIRKVDYDGTCPLYFFEEKKCYELKEKHLTAFNELIPKLEKHIEDCNAKLKELREAENESRN